MLPPFPNVPSVIVVGAGVIGLAAAITLQRLGWHVTLVDRGGESDAASWGNAGHIAIEQAEPLASPAALRSVWRRRFSGGGPVALPPREVAAWLPFGLRMAVAARDHDRGTAALKTLLADALPAWRTLLGEIGAADLLREDGHFVAWESIATAANGRAAWARTDTGNARFRDATEDELNGLRALAPVVDAIRFSGTAQIISLPALAGALERHFRDCGGSRVAGRATLSACNGIGRLAVDGTPFPADRVLVTAGIASADLLAPLGHRAPLIAERGYHLQGQAPGWPETMPPVVFEDRSMIVTRFREGLRAASFVEFARRDAPADPAKWQRLASHLATLGLPMQDPVTRWMGARPTLPDYLPAIGVSLHAPNIFYAFGHNHLGLTLAATTAERIADLVMGDRTPIDLGPFSLTRFRKNWR
ncbi:glycine/D-amino acid oxidase-like deaminating enzyme [Sphingomonas sp. UYAg733]